MSKPHEITALRAELKRKLADGTYDPLMERLVKRVRRVFPNFLQSEAALFVFLVFTSTSAAYLLNRADSVTNFREWLLPAPVSYILFWFAIYLCLRFQRHLYLVLSNHVIDAMTRVEDLQNLGGWLARFCNSAVTLSFAVLFLAIIVPYHYPLQVAAHGAMGITTTISLLSGYFLLCLAEYHLITFMAFPLIISHYHIDLYEVDPHMSPSILHLSRAIRDYVYILSAHTAVGMFFMVYMGVPAFPTAFIYIIPLLGMFIFRQVALTRIVNRARDFVLDRLRNEIAALDIEQHFDNPALCNQFKAMADYYDSVKNASAGVFDMRMALLMINSILLPSTAFIITHFDQIKAYFGW